MTLPMPKAVLWDFDGTLIDSEPIWAQGEQVVMRGRGVAWGSEHNASFVGQSMENTARAMARALGDEELWRELADGVEEYVGARLAQELPWIDGARELLEDVAGRGVRMAVVTASSSRILEAARPHLERHVKTIVTANDVTNHKPHPEAYQTAMERLGVAPEECLVVEDSIPGVASGRAAGAVVYAVPVPMIEMTEQPGVRINHNRLTGTTWPDLLDAWRTLK
ncbi:HAD family hydrolase [Tessaracoccus caeni]|uniref:HAD family hydrolase n=1 Tax=Tessaracoccus caeni TaxID=3031239 RepID=UPI0023DC1482|nr:HAD family phosphatase [Tessaracoccus caeni]MDF1489986.1 HAD family phosphatase [Tessaracoccus caeni]